MLRSDTTPRHAGAVDRHIGERLREHRLALGWPQKKLADALGVSIQQIQKYETGRSRIAASRMLEAAQVLGISVIRLFDGLASAEPSLDKAASDLRSAAATGVATAEGLALNRAFAAIEDAEVRAQILALVSALAAANKDRKPSRGRS